MLSSCSYLFIKLYFSFGSPTSSTSSSTRFPIAHYSTYNNFSDGHRKFLASVTTNVEPMSYKEAIVQARWRQAMQQKVEALERNHTFGHHRLTTWKEVYWISVGIHNKIQYNSDVTIERDKSRLVVLGKHQIELVDFIDTFSPVAKMVSVRAFLAIAIAKKWEIHQLDVNNAFLHGHLPKDVYMYFPPGFSSYFTGKVCKLRKSLYGV